MKLIILLLIAAVSGCAQVASAATPIPLTTTAGVCTFNADAVTATPGAFKASGAFGPGCPGYVPPTTQPPVTLPPAACGAVPAGRVASLREKFIPSNLARVVNATTYDAIFGSVPGPGGASYTPPLPWPGYGGNVTVLTFPNATGYAALEFRTPANLSVKRAGSWANAGTGSTVTFEYSLSECPGVFNAPTQQYCWARGGEGQGVSYGAAVTAAKFACPLKPDTTYYFNFRPSPGQACPGGVCAVSLKHSIYGT